MSMLEITLQLLGTVFQHHIHIKKEEAQFLTRNTKAYKDMSFTLMVRWIYRFEVISLFSSFLLFFYFFKKII